MGLVGDIGTLSTVQSQALSREDLRQSMLARFAGQTPGGNGNAFDASAPSPLAMQPNTGGVPVPPSLQPPPVSSSTDDTTQALNATQGSSTPATLKQPSAAASSAPAPLPSGVNLPIPQGPSIPPGTPPPASGSVGIPPPPISPNMAPPSATSLPAQSQAPRFQPGMAPQWAAAWQKQLAGPDMEVAMDRFRVANPTFADQDIQSIMAGNISPALQSKIETQANPVVPAFATGTQTADYLENTRLANLRLTGGERAVQPMAESRFPGSPDSFAQGAQEYGQGVAPFFTGLKSAMNEKQYTDQIQKSLWTQANLPVKDNLGNQLILPQQRQQDLDMASLRDTAVNDMLAGKTPGAPGSVVAQIIATNPRQASVWNANKAFLGQPIQNPLFSAGGANAGQAQAARARMFGQAQPEIPVTAADQPAAPPAAPQPDQGSQGDQGAAPAKPKGTFGKGLSNYVPRMALPQADKDAITAALNSGTPEATILQNPKVAAAAQAAGYKPKKR